MSYELMFQKAVALHQNGALNEAESIYRQILETAPDNADVLNLLGLIAQAKGIHNEAVTCFYKAALSAPKHFPIFFNLAVSLEAMGRHLEATEAYQKVLTLKPDVKEAYLGLGNIFWQRGKTDEAMQAFENALKIDENYVEAEINLAELKDDTAELQKFSAQNATALYYLGRRAFKNNEIDQAAEYLQKADTLSSSAEIKILLGQTLLQQNQKEEALKIFYQAVSLNPHDATALVHIADLEAENGHSAEAEKYYKKAIEVDAANLQAHTNYANLLCSKKRTLEALEEYRQAVIISPQTPELSYNLALILKSLEDYEQALALMFNAFYLAPEHIDWSLNLAETLILLNRKEPEKALTITKNWFDKMPDNVIVKHLWDALHGRGSDVEMEYNRLLFDTFAPTYEQTLKNIHYQVVEKIAEEIPNLSGRILDLGCGTGLVGETLKTQYNTFYGVDISEKMLEIARQKNIYSDLICQDITTYLQRNKEEFDTIVAADVFCYFGSLDTLINLCGQCQLVFSVETDNSVKDWQIQDNGRYKHNPAYIEKLLRQAGYSQIKQVVSVLRRENGAAVDGALFIASF